jgi:protein phosphatase
LPIKKIENRKKDGGSSVENASQALCLKHRDDPGPFDIIGDIHGCFDELYALLLKLGYQIKPVGNGAYRVIPPQGYKAVFLGDLVDRGPKIVSVLKLAMSMVNEGSALCLPGNHDNKLLRKLCGRNVHINHGLPETLEQLGEESSKFLLAVRRFLESFPSHYVLDNGKLVLAHAGLTENLQGIESRKVMDFALYGHPTGETDENGLPVRYDWAADYRGNALVVYGHTPVATAQWVNRTIDIDTGCVFGGKLTALRYPELVLVEVPALRTYCESARPFLRDEARAFT